MNTSLEDTANSLKDASDSLRKALCQSTAVESRIIYGIIKKVNEARVEIGNFIADRKSDLNISKQIER